MPAPEPPRRHTGGLIVVVALGFVFFILLSLLVCAGGKKRGVLTDGQTETLTVLPPSIRLRTQPNAKAPVVATATAGEKLDKLEDHGVWVRVKDPDGLEGWAERSTLERTAERERRLARFDAIRKLPALHGVATQRTPLYAGPGIFYPLVGEISEGSEVEVFTRDHDFYAVGVDQGIAYADVDSINVTARGGTQFAVAPSESHSGEEASPPTETSETTPPPPQPEEPAEATMPTATTPVAAVPAPVTPTAASAGVYAAVPVGGTQPEEIDRVIPRYPAAAREAAIAGPVVIRGIVRKDGTIDDVQIIRDLPYGLGEAAREAVVQWRFRPATFHGEPIDVYYTVTVNFRLR